MAIGSSTGGPQALLEVLRDLAKSVKLPILVTQHMPATFTTLLAEHIARATGMPCAGPRRRGGGRRPHLPGARQLSHDGGGRRRRLRHPAEPESAGELLPPFGGPHAAQPRVVLWRSE